jgi:hypothetical protein
VFVAKAGTKLAADSFRTEGSVAKPEPSSKKCYIVPLVDQWQVIPKHKPCFKHLPKLPPTAPSEAAMEQWERDIGKQYKEEKVVVQTILTRWIAMLFRGEPVPKPKTKWEQITAPGFAIFLKGLREGGMIF